MSNAQLPLTAPVVEMMRDLNAADLGDTDHCFLVQFYERLAQVAVTRES